MGDLIYNRAGVYTAIKGIWSAMRLPPLCIIVLVSVLTLSCKSAPTPDDVLPATVSGTNVFSPQKGKYDNPAKEEIRALVEESETRFIEGTEHAIRGNYYHAIDAYDRVYPTTPFYPAARKMITNIHAILDENRKEEAKRASMTADEYHAHIRLNLGIELSRAEKYTEAIATWETIPKSSSYYEQAQRYIRLARKHLAEHTAP